MRGRRRFRKVSRPHETPREHGTVVCGGGTPPSLRGGALRVRLRRRQGGNRRTAGGPGGSGHARRAPRRAEPPSFVGIVRSRQSTTVQPQVEGVITRIMARSGDRVQPGTPLLEIDPRAQLAAVTSLESQRAARLSRAPVRAPAGGPPEDPAGGGRLQRCRDGAGTDGTLDQRGPAQGHRGADQPAAREPRLPQGHRPGGRDGRRRPRARGRQRHALHGAHQHRPERRARGLHRRAGAARPPGSRSACPSTWSTTTGRCCPRRPSRSCRTPSIPRPSRSWPRPRCRRRRASAPSSTCGPASSGAEEPALTVPVISLNRINGQFFAFVVENARRRDGRARSGRS